MAEDMRVELTLDGEKIVVDPSDIDGCEWREVKKVTGLRPKGVFEGAAEMDFEALAALVWVTQRRTDPGLDFEAVLKGLSLASFTDPGTESDEGSAEDEPPFG